MGRNAAIKNYRLNPEGQPTELFDTKRSRLPVIVELLRSPWIVRASDLASREGTSATKHAEQPVQVEWDAARQVPAVFVRAGARYRIEAVIQVWATDRSWWDPRGRVARRFWRVLARGGVYDLAYDRISGTWLLVGIQD